MEGLCWSVSIGSTYTTGDGGEGGGEVPLHCWGYGAEAGSTYTAGDGVGGRALTPLVMWVGGSGTKEMLFRLALSLSGWIVAQGGGWGHFVCVLRPGFMAVAT